MLRPGKKSVREQRWIGREIGGIKGDLVYSVFGDVDEE